MREIKFRGKSVDTGEWVYGYYIKSGSDFHGGERHCIAIPGTIADYAGLKFIQVDPKTVGHFIGPLDKYGREIFDGDVVKWYINSRVYTGIVEYVDRYGGGDMRNPGRDDYMCNDWLRGEYEIIGNIHENPELLKEE